MQENFVEVRIRTDPQLEEELAGALSQLGFEGFWEDGTLLKCYMSSSRWDQRIAEEVRSLARLFLHPADQMFPEISIRHVDAENWNAQWESTIQPLRVSGRMIIAPSWNPYPAAPGEIVLTIDPKMSFGTGYHESTRLVLRLLEQEMRPGIRFLDVGTGTGVLAIAAIRLGASSAVGVDPDGWAYENARENARVNGIGGQVEILLGTILEVPRTPFDMIAANIQYSIIQQILPEMLARLAPHGILLLSGLLTDERIPMEGTLHSAGLVTVDVLAEHEWIALVARRT
jgi:ribosomal protein L11 methyltransferase